MKSVELKAFKTSYDEAIVLLKDIFEDSADVGFDNNCIVSVKFEYVAGEPMGAVVEYQRICIKIENGKTVYWPITSKCVACSIEHAINLIKGDG